MCCVKLPSSHTTNALDVPLFNFATLYGVNKRVKGFVPVRDIRVSYTSVTVD
jgi:peptide/nickel transport system substrate-binding protein